MISLATLLADPIDAAKAADDPDIRTFLHELQANILKGHGRRHTGHLFMSFAGMKPDAVAAVVRGLAGYCTSAGEQLRRNRRNPPHLDGGPVRCLMLSASGFRALGGLAAMPPGAAFAAGMAARQGVLNDPARAAWQVPGWHDAEPAVDAMFLMAHSDADPHGAPGAESHAAGVTADLEAVEEWLNGSGVHILAVERGFQQMKTFDPAAGPEGVEHFGYVDGRSQPLFLADDVAREPGANWSPKFSPSQFIVPDPNGRVPLAAGSYFVFRKLEQNVRGFKAAEQALATALGLAGDDRERAGAMVVGRFEDGTPLVQSCTATKAKPPNDFNFAGDPDALTCPFHAHIRKTNPRGDIVRAIGVPESAERNPIMARRGITYGAPRPMNAAGDDFDDEGQEPTGDVGLLFMAYMASIEDQFEFTQQSWVNNPSFVGNLNPPPGRPQTGIDPVIGQSPNAADKVQTWQDGCTPGSVPHQFAFADFVKMLGGEYFFAPSLSFLRGVGL